MIRQSLSQKMLQKLSPQQIQLMKLFQIPTATLDERIKEELEANPALEEGDEEEYNDVFDLEDGDGDEEGEKEDDNYEIELDDYLNQYLEDDPATYKTREDRYENEDKSLPVPVETSFHESLERQLGMLIFENDTMEAIAHQVVGSIDEDGYLRRECSSIVDDLMFSTGLEVAESDVEFMITQIQTFEPPGVGARDLRECLIIQLKNKIDKTADPISKSKILALKILTDYFDEFSKKHYQKLKRTYDISESQLKDALDEVLKLNPKPASGQETTGKPNVQYVIPDFIITNRDGELELTLNSKNAPDLKINDHYADMLRGYKDTIRGRKSTKTEKEAVMFIKQKIDSAKWFIDAIKQRQDTLYRTMFSIMQLQYDYFKTGDERRSKPMILKDIAEITGLDISTVSRVANSKFVQTEFGTKRLKDFFSEAIQTTDGKEVSTLEVKNILADIVSRESKRKPYSDEVLMELLKAKGYSIARRTIAKYRDQLNIPVARLRKEL